MQPIRSYNGSLTQLLTLTTTKKFPLPDSGAVRSAAKATGMGQGRTGKGGGAEVKVKDGDVQRNCKRGPEFLLL